MNPFQKAQNPDTNVLAHLGPLAPLAGSWEGFHGVDIAPSAHGPVETKFKEKIHFEPFGPVVNGPQVLYGLRYSTVAWPLGDDEPFHEETGYWLYDPQEELVFRCFIVPRGVNVLAGGKAPKDARSFHLEAEVGNPIYGISSNPFLDKAFKTVRYLLDVEIQEESFSYAEDTQLQIAGVPDIFHHTDKNKLSKVS